MSQTRLNSTQTLSRSLSEMEAMKPIGTEDTRSIGSKERSANLASKSKKLLLAIHRTYESIRINH
ncbi:hypothetical protein [Argonema antarcticum]|uniref:hypothetical protein n=1 Tax=Argonema antarcticum TaxID=2942763 RepID=UPI002010CB49|nr:hypothetical protein [Argonema antarcticum]MCL1470560.1 hypothetical protein [Argonema antarcticum A004/B2]